ncbi:MAG: Nudix family hydrolase [Panacagrimonas sp.]|jgi:8-oxo-dGTP diphosphatase|nr:Nudix family hydrolase [Panacagrimonas sp.]MCC2658560.1 Nudix family hydrolase [Panacagrimonas sp.]
MGAASEKPHIHVACGALRDAQGRVLLVERPLGKIAALKWEFPGGKIEAGESPRSALDRELHEEIGITVRDARPLTLFTHEYLERKVTLHTFLVTGWDGEVLAREAQRFNWDPPHRHDGLDVLPTVAPILRALELPPDYAFTRPDADEASIVRGLGRLARGTLLRLRLPRLSQREYAGVARRVITAARPWGLRMVLDRGEPMARDLGAAGVHFRQAELLALEPSNLPWVIVDNVLRIGSCHDIASLAKAESLGLHAAVVGPVNNTATHPDASVLGWEGFQALAASTRLPVYAIGGLGPQQMPEAFAHYAQGVCGISAYWSR